MIFTESQKKAIEFEGDGMIVAAAGSGKTAVLVEKIAWVVLQKKIPPSALFIATFTEKAALELKTRLAKRLKIKDLDASFLGTFHSLGARLLRESEIESKLPGGDFTVLEDFLARLEKIYTGRETLIQLLKQNDPETLDLVEEYGFHRALKLLLDLLPVQEMELPESGSPGSGFPYPTPLEKIRTAYQDKKQRRQVLDFHDLEINTLQLLKKPEYTLRWRSQFRYFFIDEFQDTNPVQWQIINQLYRRDANRLVLVGDPRQSIYRFRGADAPLFEQVRQDIAQQDGIYHLNENFRSAPSIIQTINQVSQSLFSNSQPDSGQPMVACRSQELFAQQAQGVEVIALTPEADITSLRQQESSKVVQKIRSLHQAGMDWNDMALLFRTRKSIPYFVEELTKQGIPYLTKSGDSLLETPPVQATLRLMKIIAGTADPLTHLQVQLSPYGGKSLEDLYRQGMVTLDTSLVGAPTPDQKLTDWLPSFFAIAKQNYPEAHVLLDEFQKLATRILSFDLTQLSELVRFLEDLQSEEAYIPIPEEDHEGVRLMTVHAAKGLEFPVVILCDLQARPRSTTASFLKLPDGRVLLPERNRTPRGLADPLQKNEVFLEEEKKAKQEDLEESKRLLYVAMTRAVDRLILPLEISSGSDKKGGQLWSDWLKPYVFANR